MDTVRSVVPRIFVLVLLGVGVATGWSAAQTANESPGRVVFLEKKCAVCHEERAVLQAPHLSVLRRERSLFDLAAGMLNHAPLMWANLPEAEVRWPRLTPRDVANLAAYLNPITQPDPPPNLGRGQRALYQKGCLTCHTVKGQGQKVARDLGGLMRLESNEAWIAALWNHTPSMLAEKGRRGMPYATFDRQEMVDLIGFLRDAGRFP